MAKVLNIKQFVFDYGISQAELSEVLSLKQPQVSLLLNGKRKVQEKHEEAMRKKYGNLIDAYFVENNALQPKGVTIFPSAVVDEIREEMRDEVRRELSKPKLEDVEIAEEAVMISEPVIVPPAIMQRPDTDSKEWVESREAQINADRLQISSIVNATDMAWRVEDEAMRPTLFQGEYVLLKEMDDEAQVIDGRVYAIDTRYHGNLIRRVYDEGDYYRLEPINKEGFVPICIAKEGGYNRRYRILCHLSTEITILPDVDEERRRQDRLIEEVGRAGNRVDRLINLLEKKAN